MKISFGNESLNTSIYLMIHAMLNNFSMEILASMKYSNLSICE